MYPINVTSEINPLKKVLVHRPGRELLNLTPDSLGRLLFDDIPYLPVAQEEHDEFVRILKDNGVEVVYLEDLMTEVLDTNPEIRERFITQFIYEAGIRTPKYRGLVYDYLSSIENNRLLVLKTMEGIVNNEVIKSKAKKGKSLVDSLKPDTSFVVEKPIVGPAAILSVCKKQFQPYKVNINSSIVEQFNIDTCGSYSKGEQTLTSSGIIEVSMPTETDCDNKQIYNVRIIESLEIDSVVYACDNYVHKFLSKECCRQFFF